MADVWAPVRASCSGMPSEKTRMNRDDALKQISHIAHRRAFGGRAGYDRLIRAGLDALLAGMESPSLALLAGLVRSEEAEAPALFDEVLDELGLVFRPPAGHRATKWAMARWVPRLGPDRRLPVSGRLRSDPPEYRSGAAPEFVFRGGAVDVRVRRR